MMRLLGGKWFRILALRPQDTPRLVPPPAAQVQPERSKWDFSGNYVSYGELTPAQRETIGKLRAADERYVPAKRDADLSPEDLAELNRLRSEVGEYSFHDWHRRGDPCPTCQGSGTVDSEHGGRYAHPCPECTT